MGCGRAGAPQTVLLPWPSPRGPVPISLSVPEREVMSRAPEELSAAFPGQHRYRL